ncbi:MAG TPA: alpha/beta hydrolase-fold protein [Bdellovibrionota bacterium]|nr:alpha/beta hydrolase-fold protein [Bdellovibrionota bacterium]
MRTALLFAAILVLQPVVSQARAPSGWQSVCTPLESPVKGSYCVHTDPGSAGDDVLFYFAGRGTGPMKWFEEYPAILDYWRTHGSTTPTVVTMAFDTFAGWWLLTDEKPDGSPALYSFVADELMPRIERELGGVRGRRLLMGRSMGGFNAIQLLSRRQRDFERAALLCPAILTVSSYSPAQETFDYMKRTGADVFSMMVLHLFNRTSFRDDAHWKEHSPLEIGAKFLGPDTPRLHISCGMQDHYGFQEGAEKFAELARSLSQQEVTWQPVPGNHCSFDSEAIARYFTE